MRSDLRGRSRVLLWYPGAVAARTLGSVRFGSASHSRDSESEFCADLTFPELGPVYVQTFDANLKALTPIPVQVSTTPIQSNRTMVTRRSSLGKGDGILGQGRQTA
jgi:hypothetical protein